MVVFAAEGMSELSLIMDCLVCFSVARLGAFVGTLWCPFGRSLSFLGPSADQVVTFMAVACFWFCLDLEQGSLSVFA